MLHPPKNRMRQVLATLLIAAFISLPIGCDQTHTKNTAGDVSIASLGPVSLIAKQVNGRATTNEPGNSLIKTASTDGLAIVAGDNCKIGSLNATIYYDNNLNGKFDSEGDGFISKINDTNEDYESEVAIGLGTVHSAPGVGTLRIEGSLDIKDNDGNKTIQLASDLSPIFDVISDKE